MVGLVVYPGCIGKGIGTKFHAESSSVEEASDSLFLFQSSMRLLCETVLAGFIRAGFIRAGRFHNVSVLVRHPSKFYGNKISTVVRSDCQRDVALNIFEIYFCIVGVNFKAGCSFHMSAESGSIWRAFRPGLL